MRVFDHGELRLVVLALIAESPRHGYEIIKAIEERLAGSYSPSPGVIYPTLTLLQELGHATVEEQEGKKLYTITAEGQRFIADNQVAVDAALARIKEVSARHGGGPAPQVVRAMENLKTALRLRMGRGPLTEAQLQSVAAAIDAAALAVERS
jgi:DNA-binding PadR family transcriptional regulator